MTIAMIGLDVRMLIMAACILVVAPAFALDRQKAEAVVAVLEELSPARGEAVYYDDEAAADWFEFDQEGDGRIVAAGFTQESWETSYEHTMKGFMATIPEIEFRSAYDGFEVKIGAIPGLTDAQKREAMTEWQAQIDRATGYRSEGALYVHAVRDLAERLRALSGLAE
ncbi:hypothetical protein [Mesorhizobium sp. CAU 1732]|uniref:hypothetical protein n=1 Tax=Mesorhizobium sp. CAU 1732 TaxID=3140358 RepID=UPI003260C28B